MVHGRGLSVWDSGSGKKNRKQRQGFHGAAVKEKMPLMVRPWTI
ncbi:hypothetical protein [Polaromonas sp. CG9_12]|nr:hypothetical protein [Polaromonas sp. CG9_12]